MLAKLFHNISIPSLARALFFSMMAAVLTALWYIAPAGELEVALWGAVAPVWLYKASLVLLVVLVAFGINTGVNKIGFMKRDYQLLFAYTLLTLGFMYAGQASMEVVLCLPLGALAYYRLLLLAETVNPAYILFDTGALLGLLTLLVPENAFFLVIIWVAVFNFGHGHVRTLLMPLMGVAAVYFMVFALMLWWGGGNLFEFLLARYSSVHLGFHLADSGRALVYLPLLAVMVPALLETVQIYGKANVRKRQVFTFIMISSVVIGLAGAMVRDSGYLWVWLSMPMALLMVNLLHYCKRGWQKDVYFLLVIGFLVLSIWL